MATMKVYWPKRKQCASCGGQIVIVLISHDCGCGELVTTYPCDCSPTIIEPIKEYHRERLQIIGLEKPVYIWRS